MLLAHARDHRARDEGGIGRDGWRVWVGRARPRGGAGWVQARGRGDPGPGPPAPPPLGRDVPYANCATAATGTACLFLGAWPPTPNDAVLFACPPGASLTWDASYEVQFSAASCAATHFATTPSIIASARPRALAAYGLLQHGLDPMAASPLVASCLAQSSGLLDALLPPPPGVTSFDARMDRVERGMVRESGGVRDAGVAACPGSR